jgi:Ca-activated chloride channel homolog
MPMLSSNSSESRTRRLLLRCCTLLCCALFTPLLAAQAQEGSGEQNPPSTVRPRRVTPPDPQGEPDEVLRVETDLVPVDVTVTDALGQPVRNLRQQDFKLYEDGKPRAIDFFSVERRGGMERPVAIVFALDVSGSMTAEEMMRLRGALQAFSRQLSSHQALYAVMSFGMNVKTLQTFTGDPQKLDRAFERLAREPNGLSTHTYDAVDDAIRLLVRHAPRTRERRLMKRAVVVVTDGFPVGDTVSAQTVIERANAADVSIYTVTLPSYSRLLASTERTPLPTPLDVSGLAEKSGGTSVYANDGEYEPLFRALAEEVTSAYVIAFYPTEEKRRDGQFHTIRIEAPPGLAVRQSRPGYKSSEEKK